MHLYVFGIFLLPLNPVVVGILRDVQNIRLRLSQYVRLHIFEDE
jgi:hypothetical protein